MKVVILNDDVGFVEDGLVKEFLISSVILELADIPDILNRELKFTKTPDGFDVAVHGVDDKIEVFIKK